MQIVEDVTNQIAELNLNFKDIYTIKIRAGTIEKKIRLGIHRCTHDACRTIFNINSIDKISDQQIVQFKYVQLFINFL